MAIVADERNGNQWWNSPYHDGPMFTWDIMNSCNYRCLYCWHDRFWDDFVGKYPLFPAEKWLEAWRNIHVRYGRARIDIVGGEPFTYPGYVPFLIEVTKLHRILFMTNLSVPINELKQLLDNVTPDQVHLIPSFHPTFAPLEKFLEKLRLLRDRGFCPAILYVMSPVNLPSFVGFRRAFEKENVPFVPLVFNGTYGGRHYPESYTEEERTFVASAIPGKIREGRITYELNVASTQGKRCYAGSVYGVVNTDGNVYRCAVEHKGTSPLGNIFDPNFRLRPVPSLCSHGSCISQDFRYLEEQMSKLGGLPNRICKAETAGIS